MREGWEMKKLGDVCDILDSKRKPITKRNRIPGHIPYYGATGVLSYVKDYLFDEQLVLLGEDGAKWESCDNSAFIINGKTWVNNHAHVLRPKRDVLDDYWLAYNLNFQNLMPFISGMTVPKLNQGNMRKIPIPIPPLPEQKQIVTLLDKAFAAIDQAQANIEKNIENAKELFQSKLNEIFSQPARPSGGKGEGDAQSLSKGWEEKKLGEVCEYDKTKYNNSNLPYVGLEHIESNSGKFIGKLNPFQVKSSTFKFDERHVLYGRLRPYLNKVLVPNFNGHCSTEIFPILTSNLLDRGFLFYWLLSPKTVSKIDATWTGARMPRANMNEVIKFKLFIPKIETQKQIVNQLNDLKTATNEIETQYHQKLANLEELKKSILQKAFLGELTVSNLDLKDLKMA